MHGWEHRNEKRSQKRRSQMRDGGRREYRTKASVYQNQTWLIFTQERQWKLSPQTVNGLMENCSEGDFFFFSWLALGDKISQYQTHPWQSYHMFFWCQGSARMTLRQDEEAKAFSLLNFRGLWNRIRWWVYRNCLSIGALWWTIDKLH